MAALGTGFGQPLTLGLPGNTQSGPQRNQQPLLGELCGPELCGPLCGQAGLGGDCGGPSCCAIVNGIVLILFGAVSLGLGSVVAEYYTGTDFAYAYAPLWAGILVSLMSVFVFLFCI